MSKHNYYIDGCSYTFGHEPAIKAWHSYFDCYSKINLSHTAKSNEHMFFNFLNNVDRLTPGTRVVIFWTHSERYVPLYRPNPIFSSFVDVKNLTSNNIRNTYAHIVGYSGENFHYEMQDAYLIKTLYYIYAVQQECRRRDLNYYFITVDPFYKYKKLIASGDIVNWADKIDMDRIFNWPCPSFEPLENIDINSYDYFIAEWSLTGLITSWCRAFGQEYGINYFAADLKHMNSEGHKLFAEQLNNWMDNTDHNLLYLINNLSYDSLRHFKDLTYSAHNYKPSVHWIEKKTYNFLKSAKLLADFVYEK